MRNYLFLFLATLQILPVCAASEPIKIDLVVSRAISSSYADFLLASPAYATLALSNVGMPISLSRPVKILSRESIQIGSDSLNFLNKKNGIFNYTASIGLVMGKTVNVPVEIDSRDLDKGILHIRVFPPLAGLIPNEIIVKVESKLQNLANENIQKKLSEYLLKRSGRSLGSPSEVSQLLENIAFDAINQLNISGVSRSSRSYGDVGLAEPLESQWPLIFAVMIWIIGLPIFLLVVRLNRLKNNTNANT